MKSNQKTTTVSSEGCQAESKHIKLGKETNRLRRAPGECRQALPSILSFSFLDGSRPSPKTRVLL